MNEAYLPNHRTVAQLPYQAFPDRGTVLVYGVTYNANREGSYGYVPAEPPSRLADIPCRIAPMFLIRPENVEQRTPTGTTEVNQFTCMLKGLYPEITLKDRFEISGKQYDIVAAEPDGSHVYTRLGLVLRVS